MSNNGSGDENESLGYAGYMWEPKYSEEELFERLSDTDDGGDIGHARSADLTWCTCIFAHRCQASKKVHAAKNLSIYCLKTAGKMGTFHILYILRDCIHVTLCLPVSFDDKH